MHFQAYLLDGLMRWNADRALAAVSSTGSLITAVNQLSTDVLGKPIKSHVQVN